MQGSWTFFFVFKGGLDLRGVGLLFYFIFFLFFCFDGRSKFVVFFK